MACARQHHRGRRDAARRTRLPRCAADKLNHMQARTLSCGTPRPLFAMSEVCPLYPRKRTFAARIAMSAFCQERTFAPRNYSSVRVALKCEIAAINNRSVVIAETKQ